MKKYIRVTLGISILFLLMIGFYSCEKYSENSSVSEMLAGKWGQTEALDGMLSYQRLRERVDTFDLQFNGDNTLVQRSLAGGCATPPVAYALFDGTWSEQDSLLSITVDYWGGVANYEWKIVALTGDELKIRTISRELLPNY
ncbi:MAG: hypothetical protein JW801_18030 [Bacteroidales bacterium]|nr:hypothetical protein [Bacteroidales bacterium]